MNKVFCLLAGMILAGYIVVSAEYLSSIKPGNIMYETSAHAVRASPAKPQRKIIKSQPLENISVRKTAARKPVAYSTHQKWMIAAKIPQSDWQYVECVINGCDGVSAEGGWDGTMKYNQAGSGAYGLCQSLPANKMESAGSDWRTNPVTQLRWCHQYAQGYGGWKQAWSFRKCLGSCYSHRTIGYVDKDHTWW